MREWTDNLSDYDRGWVEALIDSEGSFTISRQVNKGKYRAGMTWKVRLNIGNTNREFLLRAQNLIGGTIQTIGRKNPNHKTAYELQLYSSGLRVLLPQIQLLVKEKQRLAFLEILSILKQRRMNGRGRPIVDKMDELKELIQSVKQLNKRGPH